MKAWVVVGPNQTPRGNICSALEQAGIPFSLSEGNPDVPPPNQDWLTQIAFGRNLERNELGCLNGHSRAMQDLVASDLPWGMVFEDDANLDHSVLQELSLSFVRPVVISLFSDHFVALKRRSFAAASTSFHRSLTTPNRTVGYLVNKQAAVQIIQHAGRHVADWPVNPFRVAFYVPQVPLLMHSDEHSRIGPRAYARPTLLSQFIGVLRSPRGQRLDAFTIAVWPLILRAFTRLRGYEKSSANARFL